MNLANWLAQTAMHSPTRPALYDGTQMVADYATFEQRARRLAGWMAGQGVGPGDRVALYLPNTPDYLVALFGIWMAGAAAVPVNAKLHAREVAYMLDNAEAKLAFVSTAALVELTALAELTAYSGDVALHDMTRDGFWDVVMQTRALPDYVHRDVGDMAWLFYTSGTTGKPKGVIITHGMLMSMALSYGVDVDHVSAEDAAIYAAPLSHGAGLNTLMHVRARARHVCPKSGGFEPDEILNLAAHFGSVHMFAAPTMVKRLTQFAKAQGHRGQGLRTIVYAGGPMYDADIIEAVDWFGPVFVQIYGQGECPMGITALPRHDIAARDQPGWQARLGSVGRAQSAVEVRIGDAAGCPVESGTQGEIMVRGATVMPGYWRNPKATARTLREGWLMTGDVGRLDDAGYLTLVDRSKDVIITGGSNVYPREVEEVLLTHALVTEVSVVGRAHPEWGEEVVAFIVGEALEAELDALCLSAIARFKRPKTYVRVETLPKNNYGKVLKTVLRDQL